MKQFPLLIISAILLIIPFTSSSAQDDSHDFRIYTKAGVKVNIIEGLSNTTDLELRTKNNSSKIDNYRINTSFSYKVCKYFNAAIGYALIAKPNNGETILSNRYWIDATGVLPVSQFSISLRERFQQTFSLGEVGTLLRSELKCQYSILNSIFKPYISVEPHIYLGDIVSEGRVKEVRYNIGTSIAINKYNDLQVYGRYTQNPDFTILGLERRAPDYFILGVNYYYKF